MGKISLSREWTEPVGTERIAVERAPRHVNAIFIHNTNNAGLDHKASVGRMW